MSSRAWIEQRTPRVQVALGAVGMVAFCVFARCWRDTAHVFYDVLASFAVFSFIAQLLLERMRDKPTWFLAARFGLLAAMTVVCSGRHFFGWNISGHLSCVLAVALVQTADRRLPRLERAAYWVPLPVVLAIRWFVFDQGDHAQTYHAVLFALIAVLPAIALARTAAPGPDTSSSR
jgi:hypothetical protein